MRWACCPGVTRASWTTGSIDRITARPSLGTMGDVAVSVAARVDEAAPEAADDWMPCSASAGSVAVVVREPLARFLAGVATATTAGTAHAAAWSAWREKRGHEAAEDEAKIGDAATAYARDVTAGFRHTATQPVAARAVGKAWPRAVHVVVVRVEKEVQASENVLTREEMYIFVLDLEPAAPAAAVCS